MAVTEVDVNDYDTIQDAIDAVTFNDGTAEVGTVLFPTGQYETATPLYVGYDRTLPNFEDNRCRMDLGAAWPGEKKNRVVLKGVGQAQIKYTGPLTDEYLIYYTGTRLGTLGMENLLIRCYDNCRGIYFAHQAYQSGMTGVYIQRARGVAFDIIDCWASTFSDLQATSNTGCGMRLWRGNGAIVRNATFKGGGSDWPSASETHIVDLGSNVVQMAADTRAMMHIQTPSVPLFENINIEAGSGDVGIYADCSTAIWRTCRFEGDTGFQSLVKLPDWSNRQVWENMTVYNGRDGQTLPFTAIFECGDNVSGNKFSGIGILNGHTPLFSVGENFINNQIDSIGLYYQGTTSIGNIGTKPNLVFGSYVGYLELDPGDNTIDLVPPGPNAGTFYDMQGYSPLIKLGDGATLTNITGAYANQRVDVLAGTGCKISNTMLSVGGTGLYSMSSGEMIPLLYTGSQWLQNTL